MTQGSQRPAPWTIAGNGTGTGNDHGNGRVAAPRWAGRGAAARVPFSGGGAGAGGASPGGDGLTGEPLTPPRGFSAAMIPLLLAAGAVLGVLLLSGHFFPTPVLTRVLVPVFGLLATLAAAKWLSARHPDEPWLARILVLAVIAKEFASVLRYRTLVNAYGEVGDASVFDAAGRRYASFWLHTATVRPELDNLRQTNFMRWFTGVVYYLFGTDMIAGFILFGLIVFVGSYLWYRATVEAVPFIDRRLYFLIIMFAPSILFWPSSIGKEALMQFAIGSAALGTAHIFNGRLLRGVLVVLPGAWLMSVVRAHLLGLVALAAAAAFVIGRSPRKARASAATSSLVKPLGMVIVVFVAVFAVSAGANSLGLPTLSLSAVQNELDATTVSTSQGNSAFNNGGNSLSPLRLPQGMVTVLLRPFPWEVNSALQVLASLEGVALAAFIVLRRKSLAISLRHIRSVPFLFYCWVLTILYAVTFQAFANFGLLDRQRSLVLPALYVLLCLDTQKAREFDAEQDNRLGLTTVGSVDRAAR